MALKSIKIGGPLALTLGLPEQIMARLGTYVVLAGKNGGGKSRILNYVGQTVNDSVLPAKDIDSVRQNLRNFRSNLNGIPGNEYFANQVAHLQGQLDNLDRLDWDGALHRAIRFVPTATAFGDPEHLTLHARRQNAADLVTSDAQGWAQNVVAYIANVQDRWFETSHQLSSASEEVRSQAQERYESLNDAVNAFFGAYLERSVDGGVTIFGKSIAAANLSSGQQIALQLITALHAQADILGPSILLMDEPETHLHPGALVHLLRRIEEMAPQVQMWIATHSIPLLAFINSKQPNSIWAVTGGKAVFAGKKSAEVISDLLGTEESIGHLVSFMALPFHLASNNYAYQCLLPPETVSTGPEDRQLRQIRVALDQLKGSGNLNIVDFGAGKGRLVEVLHSEDALSVGAFDYVAYDPDDSDSEICKSAIAQAFSSSDGRYFNDIELLLASKRDGWAHCVVMTNVFHEIPVSAWLTTFSPGDLISRVTMDGGFVLIVEDQQIPVGELAHQHGFLLMNTNELIKFFGITDPDILAGRFVSYASPDGRLTAHLVGREFFARVSATTRNATLEAIRDLAGRRVRAFRGATKNYDNGLLHGLWTQQLANSVLALQDFNGS